MSQRPRKSVVMILDGLGDLPVPALSGQTPLEAAHTPVLNQLAANGRYGLVDPDRRSKIPNTHTGCGILLGVPPSEIGRLKRGPIEASGAGRPLKPGEIAVRANFATLVKEPGGYRIVDRRAGRIDEGTQALAAAVNRIDLGDGVSAELLPTDQHRCVLVLSGLGLDHRVSDTDPGDRGMPGLVQVSRPRDPAAGRTAQKINRFVNAAAEVLDEHPVNAARARSGLPPANGVITRSAGAAMTLQNVLRDRGVSAAVVAGCNTVIGLARALGFEVVSKAGFTADADTDLPGKMEAALASLERHDLVYVHVKAPDLFAHDRDPHGKKVFLERFDGYLEILHKAGVVVALSADHSTDSNSGAHAPDPVPALICDTGMAADRNPGSVNFGESACAEGTMPRQDGHDFLLRLLDTAAGG